MTKDLLKSGPVRVASRFGKIIFAFVPGYNNYLPTKAGASSDYPPTKPRPT